MGTKGNEGCEVRCNAGQLESGISMQGILTGTRLGHEGSLTRDTLEMGFLQGSFWDHQFPCT